MQKSQVHFLALELHFCGYHGQWYPYSHGVDLGVQHWNYNCTTQILIRNSSENVVSIVGSIISINKAFLNFLLMSCVYKVKNLKEPYLLIVVYLLWFIYKVSNFFWTFMKQSIVDNNNITQQLGRKGRQNPVAININVYALSYACTWRRTSKWCTKRTQAQVRDANKGMW